MPGRKPRPKQQLGQLPNAATLFRLRLYDQASADLIRGAKEKLKPLLKLRDSGNLKRIQAARTPEELLDLSPQATGLAQDAWHARMRPLGPSAVSLIQQMLPQLRALENHEIRYRITALWITELRWQGEAGAQALLACLDDLDSEAAALACVALGLLRQPGSAEKVWQCYLRLKALTQDDYFIGGLWGLIDLDDRRVAGELLEYLQNKRYFYELFGFLSLVGDERALAPLIASAMELGQDEGADPLMAATAIAHRVGEPVLLRELLKASQTDPRRFQPQPQAEEIVADEIAADEIGTMILARSPQEVEEYFALFYRGFRPQDANGVLKAIRQNID